MGYLTIVVAMLALVISCAQEAPAPAPIELVYSDFHPYGTPQTLMAKWYLDKVSEIRTGPLA